MTTTDFSATLPVDQTPKEVFNAINNVSGWWSTSFEGSTARLNDMFTVRFGEVYITSKVVALSPNKRIVWLVTDCNKPWLKDTKEWNGTEMIWEISEKNNKTEIHFTHKGLVPMVECYDVCSNAWTEYLHGSLLSLLTTGKGKPTVSN